MTICRCGKAEAGTKVVFNGVGSTHVCAECAMEWVDIKAYFWGQFVDPPKYRKPIGLNAAQVVNRSKQLVGV